MGDDGLQEGTVKTPRAAAWKIRLGHGLVLDIATHKVIYYLYPFSPQHHTS